MQKMWYLWTMEYYRAVKKIKLESLVGKRTKLTQLETIRLRAKNQTHGPKYCTVSPTREPCTNSPEP